ncbi:MAG: Na+/H+ antiporter NhaC family protein [Oscillospiraceae bacterium]
MGAVFCFLLFLAAVGLCILLGQSLILAIWVGIAAFAALGLRRGMTVRAMWDAAWEQGRKMCCVIVIYMLIGAITALWRSAGTIAFFIYHGLRIITPQLFLLVTFLLTSFISYALGTSFGVVGTLGVILMALARSGGVSVAITAGTIVAGAYFGDRCSPASSSATLVAAATDTKLYDNLHMMHRTGWLPYLVSLAAYAALSVTHPLAMVDSGVLDQLSGTFSLSWWTAIPALLILILPLCKVPIRPTMAVSALTALLGGMGVLNGAAHLAQRLARRAGRFPACAAISVVCSMVFCNQSTCAVVCNQLLGDDYTKRGHGRGEMALDIENSGIVLSPLIPWNISVSIPLAMLGADMSAIPYEILLYAIPLCYWLTKRRVYPPKGDDCYDTIAEPLAHS